MNIFKVLASGDKKFPEEHMSALLAWLLHPKMEHGLGSQFTDRFMDAVAGEKEITIKHRLRDVPDAGVSCAIEYRVEEAFIDIVYYIDDVVVAIENKIYDDSVTENQLLREYNGLRKESGDKRIIMVYLVPRKSGKSDAEYNRLISALGNSDKSAMITWTDTIRNIIEGILSDEAAGRTEPVPEYTKHTLKALNMFIQSGFNGYGYEKLAGETSDFPRKTFDELRKLNGGYVGVRYGIAGLVQMEGTVMASRTFQYDDSRDKKRINWLPLAEFIALAEWRINGTKLPIDFIWDLKLSASDIYTVVSQSDNSRIYIGIQGGENALRNMSRSDIQNKFWQMVSSDAPRTSQWISGARFKQILDEKGCGE